MNKKKLLKLLTDWIIWSGAFFIAFLLKFDFNNSVLSSSIIQLGVIWSLIKLIVIFFTKGYNHSWRNTSFADIFKLLILSSLSSIGFILFLILNSSINLLSLSIFVIEFILTTFFWLGFRAVVRYHLKYRVITFLSGSRQRNVSRGSRQKSVLIVGAGESGVLMAKEMLKLSNSNLIPVAFVDDDLSKVGSKIYGISVLGTLNKIPEIVIQYSIDEIVIAMSSVDGSVIRRVVEICNKTEKPYKIIPSIFDLLSGKMNANALREVAVEDLLCRNPVTLDIKKIENFLNGRIILITGAGGSIGSELVRQILKFKPKHLILLGRGENSIFQMKLDLKNELANISHSIRIADIRDHSSLEHIIKSEKPDVIFHAAAHKHVPLMEKNPAQAVLNNVIGTRNLINLAVDFGVKNFVNISTDKAVNPTSIMGASKRISELIVKWGALKAVEKDTGFVSVRFGNVLGSRGSVIPIFKNQIKNGGPVTVTHPDMIRYFMTISEASQLVLQAAALRKNGSIFVLDMGDPVNISDMAKDLIRLSGLVPDKDIKIEYTGIRPGEKMFEELLTSEEGTSMTTYEKVFIANDGFIYDELVFPKIIDELMEYALENDEAKIREKIYEIVPSFTGIVEHMN